MTKGGVVATAICAWVFGAFMGMVFALSASVEREAHLIAKFEKAFGIEAVVRVQRGLPVKGGEQ